MDYYEARAQLHFYTNHIRRGECLMMSNACFTAFNVFAFVALGSPFFVPFAAFHAGIQVALARRLQWESWYAYHLNIDVQMWERMFTHMAGGRPQ